MTSEAGLLLPRQLAERLGLSALIERPLTDPRTGRSCQFALPDLFRLPIYSRVAGYEDTNDAARLARTPFPGERADRRGPVCGFNATGGENVGPYRKSC